MAIISNFPGGGSSEAVVVSATAPSDTTKLWRSTEDNKLRFYNGTAWSLISYAAQIKDWRSS